MTMNQTRRKFLLQTGCGVSAAALLSSFDSLAQANQLAATASDYRALVCIFLFGGNDGNNTVIPYTNYAAYNAVRGASSGINIPQASLLQVNAPSQGADFGLHPNLAELQTLYNQGKLAVMANVGTLVRPVTRTEYLGGAPKPENLFSHSDQQTQWQAASTTSVSATPTGWGGRTADQTAGLNGTNPFPMLVSTAGVTLFTTGANARPLVPGANLAGFPTSPTASQRYNSLRAILGMESGSVLGNANNTLMNAAIDNTTKLNSALTGVTLTTPFPNTSLGNQLKQIAQIIKARGGLRLQRQIFFASLGGFDTHSNQLGTQVTLLTQVSQAMKAFYDATVEMGVASNVTTFTHSDFGRTFQPAAGAGSDHAWGNHHFVLGDAVRGGDFYGKFPTLQLKGADDASSEGRWIPTTSVDQYGATLALWYGLSTSALPAVFPNIRNFTTADVGFLNS